MSAVQTPHLTNGEDVKRDWLESVALALGWERPDDWSIESTLVRNADRLHWPSVVVIPVPRIPALAVRTALETAVTLAEATKNLPGPLHFVFVLEGDAEVPSDVPSSVWEPLVPVIDHAAFWRARTGLVDVGFDIYLSLRVYWEAAGEPDRIRALSDVFGVAGTARTSPAADDVIDRAFDAVAPNVDARGLRRLFELAFPSTQGGRETSAVLDTGVVYTPALPLRRLRAAGLAWCPPESPQAFVTVTAARALEESCDSGSRHAATPAAAGRLVRVARRNPLVSMWVLGLTAYVERALAAYCRRNAAISDVLVAEGLGGSLAEERERAKHGLVYDIGDDLIDFASMGDLQHLVTRPSLAGGFPVAHKDLDLVRRVRNSAAHLHAVNWNGVRAVLNAVDRLRRYLA